MQLHEVFTRCEACGQEMPEIKAEVIKASLAHGGRRPRIGLAELRHPYWCERCNDIASSLVGALAQNPELIRKLAGWLNQQPVTLRVISPNGHELQTGEGGDAGQPSPQPQR